LGRLCFHKYLCNWQNTKPY